MTRTRPFAYSPLLKPLLRDVEAAYRRRDDAEVERLLREAAGLAPQRLDLLFDLASHRIQVDEVEPAIDCYRRILAMAPGDVDALTYLAHWNRFAGCGEAEAARLEKARSARAADLRRIWQAIDADAAEEVSDRLPGGLGGNGGAGAAIVILGYRLNPDGSLHDVLTKRLERCLEAASLYPKAVIVVTGGLPRNGLVEAVEMRKWLEARGVDGGRIHEEGYARDVVENILYTRHILENLRIRDALAVTSAVNVRRTRIIAGVAAWASGSSWRTNAMAAEIGDGLHAQDAGPGEIKIYRDALRAYGMPMMRSFPEFVEL